MKLEDIPRRKFLRLAAAAPLALTALIDGCGGSSPASSASSSLTARGSARLTITWPATVRAETLSSATLADGTTRRNILVPVAYVVVVATQGTDSSAFSRVFGPFERPNRGIPSAFTLSSLPSGTVQLQISSYPADIAGVRQSAISSATVFVAVAAGAVTALGISMASRIDRIQTASVGVAVTTAKVNEASSIPLTATAFDASGAVVLVPAATPLGWTSGSVSLAIAVSNNGGNAALTASAHGDEGTVAVAVKDPMSGVTATISVTVGVSARYQVSFLFNVASNNSESRSRRQRYSADPRNPLASRQATTRTSSISVVSVPGVGLGKINNMGDVAAEIEEQGGSSVAATYQSGNTIAAGVPGGSGTYPLDLNDMGQLLVEQINGTERLWLSKNGSASEIPLPYQQYEYFFGGAINNSGTLVGQISSPIFGPNGGYGGQLVSAYSFENGVFNLFGPQGGNAMDINDAGQVAGLIIDSATYDYDIVIWQNAQTYIPIGVSGQYYTANVVINAGGSVLVNQQNFLSNDGSYQNFLWIPDSPNGSTGSLKPFDTLPAFFFAADMNDKRDIVGIAATSAEAIGGTQGTGTSQAVLIPGGSTTAPVDLNTMIGRNSGWVLEEAYGINNAGQITGAGTFTNSAGVTRYAAFLLTPTL